MHRVKNREQALDQHDDAERDVKELEKEIKFSMVHLYTCKGDNKEIHFGITDR